MGWVDRRAPRLINVLISRHRDMSASLNNTMSGMQVNDQYDQLAMALQQAAAQQAQQASEASNQAQSQYQQAAAQPPPTLSPADTFIPTLLSNIASVIGQNPSYRQTTQETIAQQRKDLIANRLNNLTALRDNMLQKAALAEKAGDTETTLATRLKIDQLDKAQADLLEKQKEQHATDLAAENRRQEHLNRLSEIAAQGAQQRQTNAAKAGADQQEQVDNEIKTSGGGQDYLPLTSFKGKEAVSMARTAAAQKGIPLVSEIDDDRLGKLKTARQNVRDMVDAAQQVSPRDWKEAINPLGERGAVSLKAQDISGSNPAVTSFKNFYEALIEQLVAVAGGRGSNVRINQQELKGLMQRSPNVTTPIPVTLAWAKRIERLIDNAESPVLQRRGRPAVTPSQAQSTAPAPAAAPAKKVKMLDPSGKPYTVDQSEVAEATKNGWKVVR